ncbi:helix-turn-helix transcriptional regulator [Glutamicibacter sp. X7]
MSTKHRDEASKAERLTSLIYAMATTRGKVTAEFIGNYLNPEGSAEAKEKAIERLKEEIRNEFGLRVISELTADDTTYYRIDRDDWLLPPLEFSPAETGLIALAATLWKDSKLQSLGLNAAARVTGAVDGVLTPVAGNLLPRLSMDEPNFKQCALAVFNRRTVRFDYRDSNDVPSRRVVDLWGIGQRYGNWYFTGWDHSRADRRVFRLARVEGKFAIVNRGKAGTDGTYHPRPDDFDMNEVLLQFDAATQPVLARVQLLEDSATPLRARAISETQDLLEIPYAGEQSFAQDLASYGPAVEVLAPDSLRERVCAVLDAAATAQHDIGQQLDVQQIKFRPSRPSGRGSTAQQVMRNIELIQYVVAHGNVSARELSERFDIPASKLPDELAMLSLCGVPYGYPNELINVNDGDYDAETISISNAALLGEPQKLAPMEAIAVLGGLNALRSVPEFADHEILGSALAKVNEAVARFDGWNGALGFALSQARDHDVLGLLHRAVAQHHVLRIDYYSAKSGVHAVREIEPVRMIEDGTLNYVLGYCRTRQAVLTFRVDRILNAELLDERFEPSERHEPADTMTPQYASSADDESVVVYVAEDAVPAVEAYRPVAWSTARVAGGYLAKIRFADALVAAPLIAREGGRLAVVSPADAKEKVEAWLSRARAMYKD